MSWWFWTEEKDKTSTIGRKNIISLVHVIMKWKFHRLTRSEEIHAFLNSFLFGSVLRRDLL